MIKWPAYWQFRIKCHVQVLSVCDFPSAVAGFVSLPFFSLSPNMIIKNGNFLTVFFVAVAFHCALMQHAKILWPNNRNQKTFNTWYILWHLVNFKKYDDTKKKYERKKRDVCAMCIGLLIYSLIRHFRMKYCSIRILFKEESKWIYELCVIFHLRQHWCIQNASNNMRSNFDYFFPKFKNDFLNSQPKETG